MIGSVLQQTVRRGALVLILLSLVVTACGGREGALEQEVEDLRAQLEEASTSSVQTPTTTTTTQPPTSTTTRPTTTTTVDPVLIETAAALADEVCSSLDGVTADQLFTIISRVVNGSDRPLAEELSTAQVRSAAGAKCPAAIRGLPRDKWQRDVWTSPFDDSEAVAFTLRGNSVIEGWLTEAVPTLVLRCLEDETDVYVKTEMSAEPEYGLYGEHTVVLRFDSDEAYSLRAGEATNGKTLFLPSPISLIRQMTEKSQLLFAFTPYNSDPGYTTFDLAGVSLHIEELREKCNW